jgi:hypothetical protein
VATHSPRVGSLSYSYRTNVTPTNTQALHSYTYYGLPKLAERAQENNNNNRVMISMECQDLQNTNEAIDGLRKDLSDNLLKTKAIYDRHMTSPKRASLGSNSKSYLLKRCETTDAKKRRNKIRDAMLSGVDSVLGDSSKDLGVPFKEEDTYLKRLLKSKTFNDIDKPKTLKAKGRKKTRPKTVDKQKSLSIESTASTVTTEDSFPSITYVDYSNTYKPQGIHTIELLPPPSPTPTNNGSVRFAETAELGYVDELSDSDFELLFYTDDELADQRHEAFLEMCGIDDAF